MQRKRAAGFLAKRSVIRIDKTLVLARCITLHSLRAAGFQLSVPPLSRDSKGSVSMELCYAQIQRLTDASPNALFSGYYDHLRATDKQEKDQH